MLKEVTRVSSKLIIHLSQLPFKVSVPANRFVLNNAVCFNRLQTGT